MPENYTESDKNSNSFPRLSKYFVFLLTIIGASLLVRLYYFPFDVPLSSDALYYFWYGSDIYQIGTLPTEWSPSNNGWPIFVSIFFSIFNFDNIFAFMELQKILSVIISILLAIPVYFLCKKFVSPQFALVGSALIAFDPRLLINSFLGIADPLYLLLITISLTLFLHSNKKSVYLSFVVVSLATMIRAEGLAFFVVLSIMFLIRYRSESYKVFIKYLAMIGSFIILLLPQTIYQMDIEETVSIFDRNISSGQRLLTNLGAANNTNSGFNNPFELFIKYLGNYRHHLQVSRVGVNRYKNSENARSY